MTATQAGPTPRPDRWYGQDSYGREAPQLRLRLAAYQGVSAGGDPDANLRTVHRVVEEAAAQGVDFLCFPETFLSGYGDRETVERGALALDDPRLEDLAQRLARHDMVTLVGCAERLPASPQPGFPAPPLVQGSRSRHWSRVPRPATGPRAWEGPGGAGTMPDGRTGNTILLFDGGRRLGVYRKTMLTGSDYRQMGFCTDWDLPVWQAKGLTFGCIVCADSSYFETAATMAYQGASLLFSPHYNRIPAPGMDSHRVKVRNNHVGLAALLELYVVRANVIVPHDPHGLGYGDSAIFDPDGQPIAEAGLFREALITADAVIPQPRAAGRSRLRARVPLPVREQLAAAMRAFPADDW